MRVTDARLGLVDVGGVRMMAGVSFLTLRSLREGGRTALPRA